MDIALGIIIVGIIIYIVVILRYKPSAEDELEEEEVSSSRLRSCIMIQISALEKKVNQLGSAKLIADLIIALEGIFICRQYFSSVYHDIFMIGLVVIATVLVIYIINSIFGALIETSRSQIILLKELLIKEMGEPNSE